MDLEKYVMNIGATFLQIMSSTFRIGKTVITLCIIKKSEIFTRLKGYMPRFFTLQCVS